MKKWYKSKSIIINVVAALIASVSMLDAEVLKAIGITNTSAFLSIIGFATTVANIFLRLFADQSQPITIRQVNKRQNWEDVKIKEDNGLDILDVKENQN